MVQLDLPPGVGSEDVVVLVVVVVAETMTAPFFLVTVTGCSSKLTTSSSTNSTGYSPFALGAVKFRYRTSPSAFSSVPFAFAQTTTISFLLSMVSSALVYWSPQLKPSKVRAESYLNFTTKPAVPSSPLTITGRATFSPAATVLVSMVQLDLPAGVGSEEVVVVVVVLSVVVVVVTSSTTSSVRPWNT